MRPGFKRLRTGLLASVVAASGLAILVTAAPAGAHIFEVRGHSTEQGCNADARFFFGVEFSNGNYDKVQTFLAKDFNYPNFTPPVPAGKPRGQCIPGETSSDMPDLWVDPPTGHVFSLGDTPKYSIPFGAGGLDENEFFGHWSDEIHGAEYARREVYGKVNVRRVGRRHHRHFVISAHGFFLKAQSESGLILGGPSTGEVAWKAYHRY